MERTDFLPGSVVVDGFAPERGYAAESGIKVWSDRGKLFVRIPVDGDHPLQVDVDTLERTFDAYGYD